MIKLKELLELRNMVYTESIKPKHKKKINQTLTLWDENIVMPRTLPPENDSAQTLKEIKALSKIEPNEDFANDGDDIKENFMPLIEKNNLDITEDFLSKIIKESAKFIMELKYHYNRPRPYQVAEFYDIDLNGTTLDSMKTPSYPSGHAVQGYLIGDYLAYKDPHNAFEYRQKGEEIAQSRIVAKAHYPSDKLYGKKVSDVLFKGMKK
tara:strand:- start:2033 stop:2656 length:624 start_codon:yes stop_codon:yes gene_type:complete